MGFATPHQSGTGPSRCLAQRNATQRNDMSGLVSKLRTHTDCVEQEDDTALE